MFKISQKYEYFQKIHVHFIETFSPISLRSSAFFRQIFQIYTYLGSKKKQTRPSQLFRYARQFVGSIQSIGKTFYILTTALTRLRWFITYPHGLLSQISFCYQFDDEVDKSSVYERYIRFETHFIYVLLISTQVYAICKQGYTRRRDGKIFAIKLVLSCSSSDKKCRPPTIKPFYTGISFSAVNDLTTNSTDHLLSSPQFIKWKN